MTRIANARDEALIDDRAQVTKDSDGSTTIRIRDREYRVSETDYFIGLFDLLGFKRLLGDRSLVDVILHLESLVQGIIDMANWDFHELKEREHLAVQGPFASWLRFSDTILLYRAATDARAFGMWLTSCANLCAMAIGWGIPVRGALTRGELYVSPDKTTYLGQGLIDAYTLEQAQQWQGAVADIERIIRSPLESTHLDQYYDMGTCSIIKSQQKRVLTPLSRSDGRKWSPHDLRSFSGFLRKEVGAMKLSRQGLRTPLTSSERSKKLAPQITPHR